LQRVSSAEVRVAGSVVGRIGLGIVALVGVQTGDGSAQAAAAAEKLAHLRIFRDEDDKMNLGPAQAGAEFLVISQFSLAGSLDRGRRPSFAGAAPPEVAEPLVDALVEHLRQAGFRVETGRFGARMEVELVNEGPVSFVLDLQPTG